MRRSAQLVRLMAIAAVAIAVRTSHAAESKNDTADPVSMLVMDPLALPLSCPCVAGYAQRKYEVLGEYLSEQLGRPVQITFAESIKNALEKESVDDIHIIVGKDSVVRAQGKKHKYKISLLARLTGKDGQTTQTGLIVVRAADPAQTVADLKDYRILFGPPDCDEKFVAARKLLEEAGVRVPAEKDAEISHACSDGACMVIDWGDAIRGAAVISSYAAPLLEGCGTIKKGDLRVVGETPPVPFVAAFATNSLSEEDQVNVQKALLAAGKAPGMSVALESTLGFVPKDFKPIAIPKLAPKPQQVTPAATTAIPNSVEGQSTRSADVPDTPQSWPGWLGPYRNGHVDWLPDTLPKSPHVLWRRPTLRPGLGGIAATDKLVFVGDRDAANRSDVFRCLDAATGEELWSITQPAPGQLDYDNVPRATPLLHKGHCYFFGAFGDLVCAQMETGNVIWRTNIRRRFLTSDEMPWGTCSSPLAVDDLIIVNPGAPSAAIAALDAATGETRWQTPGDAQGYGSFIVASLGGVRQIIGHTKSALHGWDAATGRELWTFKPQTDGDFNVPTPLVLGENLLVATENNGGRLYGFGSEGIIDPEHLAVNTRLNPQMSTPVAIGSKVLCVNGRLECFDAADSLKSLWKAQGRSFCEFGAMVAADDRVLIQGRGGELVLVDVSGASPKIASRMHVVSDSSERAAELLSFPALVGRRIYVRTERELLCVDIAA